MQDLEEHNYHAAFQRGPTGPDWADACRVKADELECIRKQIVRLTSTMSSINYQMDAWERRLKELSGEGLPSTIRLSPKQKLTFKPRQKLLERVKDIDKDTHGRRFRCVRQVECEPQSISNLARDSLDRAEDESENKGADKANGIQKSKNFPTLQQIAKTSANSIFSVCDPECCMNETMVVHQPLPEIKRERTEDTSIISNFKEGEQYEFVEGEKITDRETLTETLTETEKHCIHREDSTLSNSVSNKTSTSIPKSSGLNKEFKKLFKMLDVEVDKRKRERKSKEEDEEKQKAEKLHRAYSHVPSRSSGLYNEFEELFRLLDNQQMNKSRRAEQINIMSELNDVISAVDMNSPLMCRECSLGCNVYAQSRGNEDEFNSDKNNENKSQSANTDLKLKTIVEDLKEFVDAYDSHIANSSSVCQSCLLKSNITVLLTDDSPGNTSSNAVQKVRWAEELQKTYSVSRSENRDKKRRKKQVSQEFQGGRDVGYFRPNPNAFPHSSDERSQKNMQLHIKDVLIELPPIPNDLARRRDNVAGVQNELCGWMGHLTEDYPEPKDPMPSPKDGYGHLYMDQRNYRKQSFCLPAVQRFKGKKLSKNQVLRRPKVEEIPNEGESISGDNVSNPQTDLDYLDVNDIEERKYDREESDECEIDDVCAKLNFVELGTPPCQSIKRKEFSALPPIKGVGIRKEKKQSSGRREHSLELKIDQRVSGDKKRSVSPIKNVLKPLPPMKTKTTSQMMNWTQKNVGPIKVPPLDLSSMESSDKAQGTNMSVNYITDMVKKSPKCDVTCALQNSHLAYETDEFYFGNQDEKMPSDNMLRYHFKRKPEEKERESYIFSSTLLGKKIQFASDAERPVKEEFDAFAHKKYRLRDANKDVPMELVKIAMKANRFKGYNNVNHVLQESKRCASLFNSKGDSNNECKRLTSTPSRKTNIGKPNLQRYIQKSYRDASVREEAELQALRSRLRDCVREEASKKTTRWYQRQDENENISESARSAIARPCSPVSNRTTA